MPHSDPSGRTNLLINTGDGEYPRYFDELGRMTDAAIGWAAGWQNYAFAPGQVTSYLELLKSVFGILRRRYHFESNDPLMVDRTESGFPTTYTMTRVKVDRESTRRTELDARALRDLFLDYLFRHGVANDELRNEIARAEYRDALREHAGSFDPLFTLLAFDQLEQAGSNRKYRIVWGTYNELRNWPCVHGLIFTDRTGTMSDTTGAGFAELRKVLAFESKHYASVNRMAIHIDDALPGISPEVLSRVTIGPLHMPGITVQDDVWSPFLAQHASEEDFLLEVVVDHLIAKETTKPSILAGFGIGQQHPKQVFAVNRSDPLCESRGASDVERFVCLTHHLARIIHAGNHGLPAETLSGTTLKTYDSQGETL